MSNENRQIMFEIRGSEQKQPNSFQDALHNNHFKKALVKVTTSTWGEEKM